MIYRTLALAFIAGGLTFEAAAPALAAEPASQAQGGPGAGGTQGGVKPQGVKGESVRQGNAAAQTADGDPRVEWIQGTEPGRAPADTLRRLRTGEPDPTVKPSDPSAPAPKGVTFSTPSWTIPSGATGWNVSFAAGETGVTFKGNPMADQMGLMLPAGYNPSAPPPLVIAWHGFGTSHNQPMFTGIPAAANTRGWMVMSPLGIADNTFGWLPGQDSTEYMINWLLANFPFDTTRVYGVGFSMGADCIASYAARHQSGSGVRLAAVATVCGVFDNYDIYFKDTSTQPLLEFLFGGPANVSPYTFEYHRTSLVRISSMVFPYPPVEGVSPARSLAHLPIYMTWSADDNVVTYASMHNYSVANYLLSLGANVTWLPQFNQPNKHSWAILNINHCFNWFATKTLDAHPGTFTTLADRDSEFNDVTVSTSLGGVFRRFDCSSNGTLGTLSLVNTSNVESLTVDLSNRGFAANANVHLTTSNLDSSGDAITIVNLANALPPSKVRIDSVDTYAWMFDAAQAKTSFSMPGGSHTADVYYDTFDMTLSISGTPSIGSPVVLNLTGGADGELYAMLYSAGDGLTPLSFIGDGDPRWLRLNDGTLTLLWSGTLFAGGQDQLQLWIPNDPGLVGLNFPIQSLTIPGSAASIPFVVGRVSNVLDVTVQ